MLAQTELGASCQQLHWCTIIIITTIIVINTIMVTQHIPTMTDSHHGGFLSVMIVVGICQVTNSHHK